MKQKTLKAIMQESITSTFKANLDVLKGDLRMYNLQNKDIYKEVSQTL
jgi:hypothetical protein